MKYTSMAYFQRACVIVVIIMAISKCQRNSMLYDQVVDFKRILEVDLQISEKLQKLYHHNIFLRDKSDLTLRGSLVEGSFSASFFNADVENLHIDIDIELKGLRFPSTLKHCIRDTKRGFVKIFFAKDCFCRDCYFEKPRRSDEDYERNIRANLSQIVDDEGFVLPYRCKWLLLKSQGSIVNKENGLKVISDLLNSLNSNSTLKQINKNITKSTYQTTFEFRNPDMKVTFDVSVTMYFEHNLSAILNEWIHRKRYWPDLKRLTKELNLTIIITKPSSKEKQNKCTTEMQYSFTHIERKLILMLSENQRLVFYIAKCIFYKWLRPIDPKKVTSFLLKNTLYWLCEKYHRSHQIWQNDQIKETIRLLFANLLTTLKQRFMKFYFIPEINVLDNFYPNLYPKVMMKVKRVIDNLDKHIPGDTEIVLKYLEKGNDFMNNVEDLINLDNIRG